MQFLYENITDIFFIVSYLFSDIQNNILELYRKEKSTEKSLTFVTKNKIAQVVMRLS